jgi:radical SAM superfamily enzyme YgiQ (UPF0313 family)
VRCTLVRTPELANLFVSASYAVAPIGLCYVAASLRAAGHSVRVVDTTGEGIDRLTPVAEHPQMVRRGLSDDEILDRIDPATELIGFSLMFSQDWLPARALINKVRDRFPTAVLVAGGEHATAEPEGVLTTSAVDYVLAGEGDRAICQLVEHLEGTRPIAEVAGCHYRDASGRVHHTSAMIREKDIDQLPWPAWDLIPFENYLAGGHGWGVDRGRNVPMNATRGCPYQCTFCSSPTMWTTRWVARSPHDVLAEMKHHIAVYRATNFDFQDLTAIVRKDWVVEFANLLIAEKLDITWQLPSGTRSEALDDEVLQLLAASGCRNITYAPESGTEETLRRIKKKIKLDRMLHSMRQAVKAGCNVKANLMFGFPDDSYRSLLPTFGFIAKMAVIGVHDISAAPFRPYPGSELFRMLQKNGKIPNPLDDDYFRRLATTTEKLPGATSELESFSFHMSGRGLDRARTAALAMFFLISWTLRPVRVLRLIRALVTERQESRLDKSLIEMRRRLAKRWRERRPGIALGEINPY